jgi:DNA-binding response OmpR family regulator
MNTILIVDDDIEVRKILRTILTQEGFKVIEAENDIATSKRSTKSNGSEQLIRRLKYAFSTV